jgi:hypothetical protein
MSSNERRQLRQLPLIAAAARRLELNDVASYDCFES